jgi:hypothetical protein
MLARVFSVEQERIDEIGERIKGKIFIEKLCIMRRAGLMVEHGLMAGWFDEEETDMIGLLADFGMLELNVRL